MAHDVFICHSSKDRTIANAICSTLEQHRIRCWIAPRDVLPGSDYAQSIVEAIGTTRLTVLVFSDSSNHSGHVRREIERSVSHGVPILPFRVEDVVPSPSLEYFISDAHWLDAMTPPLEQHLDHLAETVRLLLEREAGARTVETVTAPAPPAAAPTAPSPVAPTATTPLSSPPRPTRILWLALGAAALVIAVVAGLLLLGGDETGQTATPSGSPSASSATGTASGPPSSSAPEGADVFVEEFLDELEPGWTWVNEDPARWTLDGESGWLEITAQSSPPIRNLLLRDTAWTGEDYAVETLLRFNPVSDFQFAGLVITGASPDTDRLQFGRAYCTDSVCVGNGLYFDRVKAGSFVGDNYAVELPSTEQYVLLSLEVWDNQVTARYSIDEGKTWQDLGTHPLDPGYTKVGILAHNAPLQITAGFEAFYLYP